MNLLHPWPMGSLFKINFSFFSRIHGWNILNIFVGCVSHLTCLFFDLSKHGLEIISYCPFLCLPSLPLPWKQPPACQSTNQLAPWKNKSKSRVRLQARIENLNGKNSFKLLSLGGKLSSRKLPSVGLWSLKLSSFVIHFPWYFTWQGPIPCRSSAITHS